MNQPAEKTPRSEKARPPAMADTGMADTMLGNVTGGSIRISEDVIAAIVKKYTLQVKGVVRFASGNFVDGLADMIRRRSHESSIAVDLQEKATNITVTIILEFGVKIPEVGQSVQVAIRKNVEDLTGKPVDRVDVIVQGLEDKNAAKENDGGVVG